jgi:hypothetical protein
MIGAFIGYVLLKRMTNWRGLEFYGLAFGKRWYVGFVRFDHVRDKARVTS